MDGRKDRLGCGPCGVQALNNGILSVMYIISIFDIDNKLVIAREFMRLLRYRHDGKISLGVKSGNGVIELSNEIHLHGILYASDTIMPCSDDDNVYLHSEI